MGDLGNSLSGGLMMGLTSALNQRSAADAQAKLEQQKAFFDNYVPVPIPPNQPPQGVSPTAPSGDVSVPQNVSVGTTPEAPSFPPGTIFKGNMAYVNKRELAKQEVLNNKVVGYAENNSPITYGQMQEDPSIKLIHTATGQPFGGKPKTTTTPNEPQSIENAAWDIVQGRDTLKNMGGMGIAAVAFRNSVRDRADEIVRNGEVRQASKTGVEGVDYVGQQGAAGMQMNRQTRYTLARIKSMSGVMDRLLKDSSDVNQSQIPVLNRIQQYLANEGGSTRFTDLQTTAGILGEEIANVIAGGTATPVEMLQYQKQLFNAFQNPDQLPKAIAAIKESLDFRKLSLEESGKLTNYSESQKNTSTDLPDGWNFQEKK